MNPDFVAVKLGGCIASTGILVSINDLYSVNGASRLHTTLMCVGVILHFNH